MMVDNDEDIRHQETIMNSDDPDAWGANLAAFLGNASTSRERRPVPMERFMDALEVPIPHMASHNWLLYTIPGWHIIDRVDSQYIHG